MPTVVFFGYGQFGLTGVDVLASVGARIAAVVTPVNRSGPDVESMTTDANRREIPVLIQPPRRAIEPFVAHVRALAPDVIIVWSYSMILPKSVLEVPRYGAVNMHGGLLPEFRGGHVGQWALISGAPEFGITLHYMDEGIDTGPVIAESRFSVDSDDDAERLREKLRAAGAALLLKWWPQIATGTAPRVPQDSSRAKYWPLRTAEQGRIDWSMSADAIGRLVRALACNAPGAYIEAQNRQVTIRRVHAVASDRETVVEPGHIVTANEGAVRVRTGDGDLIISEAEYGKRRLTMAEFARCFDDGAQLS